MALSPKAQQFLNTPQGQAYLSQLRTPQVPTPASTNQPQTMSQMLAPRQEGLFSGILRGVARGALKLPMLVGEAGRSVGANVLDRAQGYDGMLGMGPNARKASPFYSDEELTNIVKNPMQEAVTSAAAAGSFLVPGAGALGTGLKGAVMSGALAGGLGGLSETDDIRDLGKVVSNVGKGAAAGGVLGGVTYGAGSILKKLSGKPKANELLSDIRGKSIGLDPNKTKQLGVRYSSDGRKIIRTFYDTMDEMGLSTRTSEVASMNADKAQSIISKQVRDSLDNSGVTFTAEDTLDIVKDVQSKLKNSNLLASGRKSSEPFTEILADLQDLGPEYNASQLNAIREKARDTFINWRSTGGKTPNTERVAKEAYYAIDRLLKGKPGLEQVRPLLQKESSIHTVLKLLQQKATTASTSKLGTASTFVGVPTFGAQEAVGSWFGKMAQKGLPSVKVPAIPQANLLRTLAAGAAGRSVATQQPIESAPSTEQPFDMSSMAQSQVASADQRRQALFDLLNMGYSPTESIKILEYLGMDTATAGGKLSKDQTNAQSALNSLDQVESILSSDSSALGLSYLPFGLGSQNAQTLESAMLNVEDVIARLRTGAVINDEEAARYRKMMPRITDTPDTKLYKIQQLRSIFQSILQGAPSSSVDETPMEEYERR